MEQSKPDQPVRVAFLGPEGTYTHQAALQEFGSQPQAHFVSTNSIPQCFQQLENDHTIDYSVVPLENSTNGQVVFTYDLLRDRMMAGLNDSADNNRVIPTIEVVGEQYVSITHCLISPNDIKLDALPIYKKIRIHSHPQVWGQVSGYLEQLKKKCPNAFVERIDTASTSEAVSKAQLSPKEDSVLNLAIASETAAKLNKAYIIDREINDILGNTTRFLIFKRRSHTDTTQPANSKRVALMTFAVKQDDPGALVEVLTVLKNHSVNMCSINSRPLNSALLGRKWQYLFFIEYYKTKPKTNEEAFYSDMSNSCSSWCLWGTFARNERYYN